MKLEEFRKVVVVVANTSFIFLPPMKTNKMPKMKKILIKELGFEFVGYFCPGPGNVYFEFSKNSQNKYHRDKKGRETNE